MSIRKVLCLFLFCMGLTSCSEDRSTEPKPMVALTVRLGDGVVGTIPSGKHRYEMGSKLDYSFSPKSTYRDLVVEIGGSITKPSGSLVMDGDKEIVVMADSIVVLPAAAEPIKADVVRFMASSDAMTVNSAYYTYTKNLDALWASEPSAMGLASTAYAKAVEETPDEVREMAENLLGGKLYGPNGLASSASFDANKIEYEVSLITVNGMWNTTDGSAITRKGFENLVAEAGLDGLVEVYNYYNSKKTNFSTSVRCLLKALLLGNLTKAMDCDPSLRQIDKQMVQILDETSKLNIETEAASLAKVIRQERARGRRVILVGHSQGTLMVAQALKSDKLLDGCITAISLGGILGKSSFGDLVGEPNLLGFVVASGKAQDIVLGYGHNDFPRFASEKAKASEIRLNALGEGNSDLILAKWISEGISLHSVTGSYLGSPDSRQRIKEMVVSQQKLLGEKPYCSITSQNIIYASDGVVNPNGTTSGPSHLWTIDPRPYGKDTPLTIIRSGSISGEPLQITDLAEMPTGELLGATPEALYSIDKTTAVATFLKKFSEMPQSPTNVNALAVDALGRVYAGSRGKGIFIGFNRENFSVFTVGKYPAGLVSAGDLAYHPNGTIYGVGEDATGKNFLVKFEGANPTGVACNESLGAPNMWGLSFIGSTLLGLNAVDKDYTPGGSLFWIDLTSCKANRMRSLAFNAFGAARKSRRF